MANDSKVETTAVLAFIAGAALAAGVTLLLTPRTGREVRDKLEDVTDEALQRLKEAAREAKFKVSRKTKKDEFMYDGGDCWIG
jgi:gas vesicle protein